MARSDFAVGTLAGESTSFPPAHRDSNMTPITTSVVLTVPMSHEDVEAALWQMLRDEGVTFDDLTGDASLRWLLLDSLLGRGTTAIESYRMDLERLDPWDADYPAFVRLRARVETLLGPCPGRRRLPAPGPRPSRRRRVAGGSRLACLRAERGWTQTQLIARLRAAAQDRGDTLPGDASVKRRIAGWENQHKPVSDFYQRLLGDVYGMTAVELGIGDEPVSVSRPVGVTDLTKRITLSRRPGTRRAPVRCSNGSASDVAAATSRATS